MTQQELDLNLVTRRTRKAVFLDEMNLVVRWTELLSLIAPHPHRAKTGRPPFELVTDAARSFLACMDPTPFSSRFW
jgi:IS5 family transposase